MIQVNTKATDVLHQKVIGSHATELPDWLPLRATYGVSIVRISEKTDRV